MIWDSPLFSGQRVHVAFRPSFATAVAIALTVVAANWASTGSPRAVGKLALTVIGFDVLAVHSGRVTLDSADDQAILPYDGSDVVSGHGL